MWKSALLFCSGEEGLIELGWNQLGFTGLCGFSVTLHGIVFGRFCCHSKCGIRHNSHPFSEMYLMNPVSPDIFFLPNSVSKMLWVIPCSQQKILLFAEIFLLSLLLSALTESKFWLRGRLAPNREQICLMGNQFTISKLCLLR